MNDFSQDTFFEQIVTIRKTGKTIAAYFGIWFLALLVCTIIFLVLTAFLGSLSLLAVFGVLFGAYKWSSLLNVEYEYIITNGTMDVDKIINRSSRKRMLSFELAGVSKIEKFNPNAPSNPKSMVIACNTDEEGAYLLVAEREGKGNVELVFTPDERIQSAVKKFVPKYISNSAFK